MYGLLDNCPKGRVLLKGNSERGCLSWYKKWDAPETPRIDTAYLSADTVNVNMLLRDFIGFLASQSLRKYFGYTSGRL